MATKTKISYSKRLFLALLAFLWVLVICFLGFQYGREKQYKADLLNSRLQDYNHVLLDAVKGGVDVDHFVSVHPLPVADLRVTVMDTVGRVLFDNFPDSVYFENHLNRPEIKEALEGGCGFSIRRHSSTTDMDYFYSATATQNLVVRSAVPYTVSLLEMLSADKGFLWFMAVITLVISLAGYFATRRLSRTISRLNLFAKRAEKGEKIYSDEEFPHDELGEISGHIVKLYSQLQDTVTECERQHQEALKQEQEKTRIKKQLTNNINHELKTPLATMQLCLETLLVHPELASAQKQELLQRAFDAGKRLQALLGDVSTLTRLDDGQGMIARKPVKLNALVKSVADEMGAVPGCLPIGVKFPQEVTLNGNADLLSTVFRNLINNANAYSQGSQIEIALVEVGDRYCYLSFADNGVGVDDEHLPHIFERFYRVDEGRSRAKGGTGLGLAIVKNAVIFHGGSITASNRSGGGLQFLMSFALE